jgi:UDP-glucose 4-epimerase
MNVYGPRQDYRGAYIAVIMKILDAIDDNKAPTIYGDGSQAYDFVYVGDCARANVLAMKAEAVDRFYNVGTGVRTSIKELVDMVIELTQFRLAPRYEPAGLTFVKNRIGSPKRAQAELGFSSQVDLRDGLQKLITWRAERKRQAAAGARS